MPEEAGRPVAEGMSSCTVSAGESPARVIAGEPGRRPRTAKAAEEAERRVRIIFDRLKLTLHPEKTRRVNLTDGQEGFDFLGCHLHERMSGRLLEKTGNRWYYLQRWPSARSMKRVREKIHGLTDRSRNGVKHVRVIIGDLNHVLRGWGNYFRTGNAARKFNQLDECVWRRLHRFMVRRHGRKLEQGGGWRRAARSGTAPPIYQ
jgi:hypothetical protein